MSPVLSVLGALWSHQLLKVPLLSGVNCAGAEEQVSPGVCFDLSLALMGQSTFLNCLHTQLGLLVKELSVQLREKTLTISAFTSIKFKKNKQIK